MTTKGIGCHVHLEGTYTVHVEAMCTRTYSYMIIGSYHRGQMVVNVLRRSQWVVNVWINDRSKCGQCVKERSMSVQCVDKESSKGGHCVNKWIRVAPPYLEAARALLDRSVIRGSMKTKCP